MKFKDLNTKEDLRKFLGLTQKQFDFFLYGKRDKKYTFFQISKKSTKEKRNIYAPIKDLKYVQTILKEAIEPFYNPSDYANGFIKGKSIVTNAINHINKNVVINLDISNFFESIHIGRVIGLFRHKPFNFTKEVATCLGQLLTADTKLTQGSPCSPLISNMIFYSVDREIHHYIGRRNISYSRYADDITISFNNMDHLKLFIDANTHQLTNSFKLIFDKSNFSINQRKTRIQFKNMHQEVTGIKVNTKLNIKHFFKYSIRGLLHAIQLYGIKNASVRWCEINRMPYSENKSEAQMINALKGKINYVGMVCGKNSEQYIKLAMDFNLYVEHNTFMLKTTSYDLIRNNCVYLLSFDGLSCSTGFIYKGYLVTCYHCIKDFISDYDNKIFAQNHVKKKSKELFQIIDFDEKHDIAILKPLSSNEHCEIIGSTNTVISNNQKVKILGYPDYSEEFDFEISEFTPLVVNKRRNNNVLYFVVDAPLQNGSSGSPVLNDKNELIGMVCLGSKKLLDAKINNGCINKKFIDILIDKIKAN